MRLDVTRKTDLALRALIELDKADGKVKAAPLAAALVTSTGFIPQVLAPLLSRGWLRSEPGPTGGYRLVADLTRVSVLEVIEAVEGPTDTGRCAMGEASCGDTGCCAVHRAWTGARADLMGELQATTVASLAVAVHVRT